MIWFNILYVTFLAGFASFFGARFIIHHPPVESNEFFYYLMFGIFDIIILLYAIVRLAIKDIKSEEKEKKND